MSAYFIGEALAEKLAATINNLRVLCEAAGGVYVSIHLDDFLDLVQTADVRL